MRYAQLTIHETIPRTVVLLSFVEQPNQRTMPSRNSPSYAFFSQLNDDLSNGSCSLEYLDTTTGRVVKVSYMGGEIDGYPGELNATGVWRPTNHESFMCLGEATPGRFRLTERGRASLRFLMTDQVVGNSTESAAEYIQRMIERKRQADSEVRRPVSLARRHPLGARARRAGY